MLPWSCTLRTPVPAACNSVKVLRTEWYVLSPAATRLFLKLSSISFEQQQISHCCWTKASTIIGDNSLLLPPSHLTRNLWNWSNRPSSMKSILCTTSTPIPVWIHRHCTMNQPWLLRSLYLSEPRSEQTRLAVHGYSAFSLIEITAFRRLWRLISSSLLFHGLSDYKKTLNPSNKLAALLNSILYEKVQCNFSSRTQTTTNHSNRVRALFLNLTSRLQLHNLALA